MPHRPRSPKRAAKLEGGMKLSVQTGNSRQTKFKKTKTTGSYPTAFQPQQAPRWLRCQGYWSEPDPNCAVKASGQSPWCAWV